MTNTTANPDPGSLARLVRITKCSDCPSVGERRGDGRQPSTAMCYKTKRDIDDPWGAIPNWCPLPFDPNTQVQPRRKETNEQP